MADQLPCLMWVSTKEGNFIIPVWISSFCQHPLSSGLLQLLMLCRYKPGNIHIFFAGSIYHTVGCWTPLPGVGSDGITPGRIGNIFFSPKSAMKVLAGKPRGWRNNTFSSLWPSTSAPQPVVTGEQN